ncbi:MAG: hypothetical protein V2B19_19370 [Pseudomonadota bacterium]
MKKKKTGKSIVDSYRSLRDKLISDGIREAFKGTRANACHELERLGFQWVDDESDEDEIKEEDAAVPENINQEFIVGCFEGHIELSDAVMEAFNAEKTADSPNFPLLRKYFRQGNPVLKSLLFLGLDQYPTDQSLLHDLAFFHEHHGMLSELISRYITACRLENDLELFADLAMDFYYNTIDDGFEALHELLEIVGDMPQKRATIDLLLFEHGMAVDLPDDDILI